MYRLEFIHPLGSIPISCYPKRILTIIVYAVVSLHFHLFFLPLLEFHRRTTEFPSTSSPIVVILRFFSTHTPFTSRVYYALLSLVKFPIFHFLLLSYIYIYIYSYDVYLLKLCTGLVVKYHYLIIIYII